MKRRSFLLLGSGLLAGTSISYLTAKNHASNSAFGSAIKSKDGLLEVHLEAKPQLINLGTRSGYLMSYNGQVPAPRLEAKPGDTVRIHLRNNLSKPTNLHYHGLHISPEGKGDNPFIHVPPKEQFTYEFVIPKNHRGGTFWYHPHHHSLVAEQLFGGLAGLFIIRGELDNIPEIKAAREQFLVFQDFALDKNGNIIPADPMSMMMGREGNIITINGQINPTLTIQSGGLLRLRILNASPSRFYRLSLDNHPFYLIATDGGAISEPIALTELLLTPGERVEVLIRGNQEPKNYQLVNLPYERNGTGMMGHHHGHQNSHQLPTTSRVLATLTYRGSVAKLSWPKKLIHVQTLPTPHIVRKIAFSMTMSSHMKIIFLFNQKVFDPNRIDIESKLNTIEDWELVNLDTDRMEHPFHLHTNSFQVINRNGQPEPYPAWKDTILIAGAQTARIRIPFQDFVGKTMYHCHIVDHEDLGMMGLVNIVA